MPDSVEEEDDGDDPLEEEEAAAPPLREKGHHETIFFPNLALFACFSSYVILFTGPLVEPCEWCPTTG